MPLSTHIPEGPYDFPVFNKAWRVGWAKVFSPCGENPTPPADFPPNLLEPFNLGVATARAKQKADADPLQL